MTYLFEINFGITLIILATTDNIKEDNVEDGGIKNCLTTYVFNPVDTCTGTPSPEKYPLNDEQTKKTNEIIYAERDVSFLEERVVKNVVALSPSPNNIANNIKFMADYGIKSNGGEYCRTQKCCCGDHDCNNKGLNFGPLYTITGEGCLTTTGGSIDTNDERTYDEPYAGDLPRRSWLCCPGSQQHAENEQPPLLDQQKIPISTPSFEAIVKAPTTYTLCSIGCVRI